MLGVAWCVVRNALKEQLDGQYEDIKTLQNAGKYVTNETASRVRDGECSNALLLTDVHFTHLHGTETGYCH